MDRLKKVGRFLCSMKTAVFLLLVMIAVCVAGSILPQGEIESYYTGYYPEKVGYLILLFGLNDVFHCWWFTAITLFLCVNLLGCNLLRFPVLVRRMKQGFSLERRLKAWDHSGVIIDTEPERCFEKLGFRKYCKVSENGCSYVYAARNRIGIWGAWLTHLGLLIIIIGFGLGQMNTVKYTVYGVPGQSKNVGDTEYTLAIDDFEIALREDETVDQYTTQLTITDVNTGEKRSGKVSVNAPLSLFGMKMFQNSTGWAATVEIWKGEKKLTEEILCAGEHIAVPEMSDLVLAFNAFYPDYAQGDDGMPYTQSSALNHPGYLYTLYFQEGVLGMNVLETGECITVEDYRFIFRDPQPYTLIQIKRDPFTFLAAVGGVVILFALILAFYIRPEEIWAEKQDNGSWLAAGYSKKGGVLFQENLKEEIEAIKNK